MNFRRSSRLDKLPPYIFAEMEKKKRELEAKGKDIINLGIGDPDQPPPELVINKLVVSLHDDGIHQYAATQGIDEFRYAVARWMEKRYNVKLDPQKEVLHGIGSKEVIAHLPLALTEPGDVILIPEPGYPPYRSGTIFALAEPYAMPLKRENNFLPDLLSIPEDIAKKAKVIFVNYPNNPTGATATKDFYKRLVAFANKYNIIVVSDAAYAELYYEEKPISFLEIDGAKDVGIEVHSMTKTFSMAGWRMAWACGNSQILETLRGLKANLDSGQFMALQKAATAGLTTGESEMSAIRDMYRRRRDVLVSGLRKLRWDVSLPKATFYVWFPVPTKMGSMEFANFLLEWGNVVVTPGAGFGKYGEGFIRIALTVTEERLQEAVERITKLRL